MRIVFRTMFEGVGANVERGVHIHTARGGFVVRGSFVCRVAGLLCHKEIMNCKGTGGIRCWPSCKNICYIRVPSDGEYGITCAAFSKLIQHSNADAFAIIDEIALAQRRISMRGYSKTSVENVQQTTKGCNNDPDGLLLDMGLRRIYKPIDHTIRDWQHPMCQDGVAANSAIAHVLHAMQDSCNVDLTEVRAFSCLVKACGKLDKGAWGAKRLKAAAITSFRVSYLRWCPSYTCFWKSSLPC